MAYAYVQAKAQAAIRESLIYDAKAKGSDTSVIENTKPIIINEQ